MAIDEAFQGSPALASADFIVPPSITFSVPQARWSLVDANDVEYANGLVTTYTQVSTPTGLKLKFQDNIAIPDNVASQTKTDRYTLNWTLDLDGESFANYRDSFLVIPQQAQQLGAENAVELAGDVTLYAVLPADVTATVRAYQDNTEVYSGTQTSNAQNVYGYQYSHLFNTTTNNPVLAPTLDAYAVTWTFPYNGRSENMSAELWVVTPIMLKAANELRDFFNRVRQEQRLVELDYQMPDIMRWLKTGKDLFNSMGLLTDFTMTGATSVIYQGWFMASVVMACREQYILEGQRSFNFSGQSVTLDVDVTQYWDSLANQLQGQLDNQIPLVKRQLHRNGLTGGDGAYKPSLQVGAVGLSLNPASNLGWSGQGYKSWRLVRP